MVALVDAGRSIGDVAVEHGVKFKTLQWYVWRLRGSSKRTELEPEPELVPVVVREPSIRVGSAREVRIDLDDLTVRVEQGTDPSYVAALVGALRTC